MAAVRLLPYVIIAVSVNLASGYFLSAIKYPIAISLIAGVLITLSGALLTVYLRLQTRTPTIYGLSVLLAAGSGFAMLTGYSIASLSTRPENAGAALSLQNVSQLGGQVIALAIAGQVFQSSAVKNLRTALVGQGFSDEDIQSAVSGAQSALLDRLDGTLRAKAVSAIVKAMQDAFVLVPVAGGVMLLAALCMKREKLFGVAVVAAM